MELDLTWLADRLDVEMWGKIGMRPTSGFSDTDSNRQDLRVRADLRYSKNQKLHFKNERMFNLRCLWVPEV